MADWQDFLAALGGFGAGASQAIGQIGQQNVQRQFQLDMQNRLFGQQADLERMREQAATGRQQTQIAGQEASQRRLLEFQGQKQREMLEFQARKQQEAESVPFGEALPFLRAVQPDLAARFTPTLPPIERAEHEVGTPAAITPPETIRKEWLPYMFQRPAPAKPGLKPEDLMRMLRQGGEGGAGGLEAEFNLPMEGGGTAKLVRPRPEKESAEQKLVRDALREQLRREPTASEVNQAVEAQRIRINKARGAAFGDIRQLPVIDTQNGNALTFANANDINEANRQTPGRFVPAAPGAQALNKQTLLEDIRGTINTTRDALTRLPTDFTAAQSAQIALILKQRDPRSALSAFMGGAVGRTLTPEQQDYLIALAQLQENAMAMRSVLGAGQGSDELRAAILRTIPSALTPSRDYARKQLDAFEATLNRLGRGVPNVPLRQMPETAPGAANPARPPAPGKPPGRTPAGPAPPGATHWSPTAGYTDAQGNPVGGR